MVRWLALLCCLSSLARAEEPARFLHDPAVSPDGQRIAFAWRGDLWVVARAGGRANRLTDHPALDYNPIFSPDGTQIAFSSYRAGNADVYVMRADGGEPRRLTFHGGNDGASDFTADGQQILFASRRAGPAIGPHRLEFLVPVTGGTPTLLQRAEGSAGQFSPDGRKLAFVRGSSSFNRRHYRGGAAEDVWVHDLDTDRYWPATTDDCVDTWPLWARDGQALFFVSDRSGTRNLWKTALSGGEAEQLTRFADPVRNPSIARDGSVIAFELQDRIWALDLATGLAQAVPITLPGDLPEDPELWRTLTSGCSEYEVAPSGKEVAFVVRGDIYITRFPDGGPCTQLTDTPAEEGWLTWTTDSKTLWYASDREGQWDLYSLTSGDPDEPRLRRTRQRVEQRRTSTPVNETAPRFSPDGQRLQFIRGQGDIVVTDAELGHEKVVSQHWDTPYVVWSPDSQWLAFHRADTSFNVDVFIVKADGGQPVNVSQHPRADYAPTWSGDGSKLGFLSDRNNEQFDAYFVWLRRADYDKTKADRQDEEDDAFDKPKPKPADKPAEAKPGDAPKPEEQKPDAKQPDEPQPVEKKPDEHKAEPTAKPLEIDWEGLSERLTRVTSTVSDERSLAASPDGKSFAYSGEKDSRRDLFVSTWEGEARQVTTGTGAGGVSWSSDGKQLRFLRDGGRVAAVSPTGSGLTTASFEAAVRRNVVAERAYLFDAVWRIMRDEFYDPQLHGADWDAARARHRPRALAAPSADDFELVVNDLLGELNASHCGYSVPGPATSGVAAGDLGVEWSNDRTGEGLLVEAVVPETAAARSASRLSPGDRVRRVNGATIRADQDVSELLLGTVGKLVTLEVVDGQGASRQVVIRPTTSGAVESARYDAWVKSQRATAEKLSAGKVGYIHIPGMNDEGLAIFERDLFAAGDGRQALILDVRYNGGGWTADYLLGMLAVQNHAYAVPRGGVPGYPQNRLRAPAWNGPTVLLVNGWSVSNAEILAHAFQVLKRGPVVGRPTFGGVISTGATTLVDGSTLRLPGRGWYRVTDGVNEEGNPARPDVAVETMPHDEAAGRDPQLEAAVRAALAQLPK